MTEQERNQVVANEIDILNVGQTVCLDIDGTDVYIERVAAESTDMYRVNDGERVTFFEAYLQVVGN